MTRQNASLRLHEILLARRQDLGKKLADDLANLRAFRAADSNGDNADLAFEADGDEMSSRLAELDDRELSKIEQALARWRTGTFGICESCKHRIPLTRLNALPHTAFCIRCEREMEKHPALLALRNKDNWDQVFDAQAPMQDQRVNLAELERSCTGSGEVDMKPHRRVLHRTASKRRKT